MTKIELDPDSSTTEGMGIFGKIQQMTIATVKEKIIWGEGGCNLKWSANFILRLLFISVQAPYTEKLPAMYLMDSIVKNVKKGPYQQLFAKNLTNNFCGVFSKVSYEENTMLLCTAGRVGGSSPTSHQMHVQVKSI